MCLPVESTGYDLDNLVSLIVNHDSDLVFLKRKSTDCVCMVVRQRRQIIFLAVFRADHFICYTNATHI